MSSRISRRTSLLQPRRKKTRRRHNEFGFSAAAYPDGRIAVLLARYPELSHTDFREVLAFVRKATPTQLRRLRSSEVVRSKLDQFLCDHQIVPARRLINSAQIAVAIITIFLMCWLFWEHRPQPLSPRANAAVLANAASGLAMASHSEAGVNP